MRDWDAATCYTTVVNEAQKVWVMACQGFKGSECGASYSVWVSRSDVMVVWTQTFWYKKTLNSHIKHMLSLTFPFFVVRSNHHLEYLTQIIPENPYISVCKKLFRRIKTQAYAVNIWQWQCEFKSCLVLVVLYLNTIIQLSTSAGRLRWWKTVADVPRYIYQIPRSLVKVVFRIFCTKYRLGRDVCVF